MGEIKPALAPQEWEEVIAGDPKQDDEWENAWAEQMDRHAAGARALYRQPYGVTHEDVRRHRHEAEVLRRTPTAAPLEGPTPAAKEIRKLADDMRDELVAWHESMAERLAALLPPE